MIERVRDYVAKLPYMKFSQAQRLQDLIVNNGIRDCLELGFYHGVSSAYIAEILKDQGGGHLTTIDLLTARDRQPNIDQILSHLGLKEYVTVFYEPRSYTWRLMKFLEAQSDPIYDFCYIDGGHSWDVSGFGFFLVEKLLRPGGWLLFDDLDWTYERMIGPEGKPAFMRRMPEEEISTRQVRKVWELLVKQHSSFHNTREEGPWGFAQKK
jgi:predicted O-methyltransferase YrrM